MGGHPGFFWYCNLCQCGGGTRSCVLVTSEIATSGPPDHPCVLTPNWSAEWFPIKVTECPRCHVMMWPLGALDEKGMLKITCPKCDYTEFQRAI